MVQWTLGMNKANLRPSERTGGQIGEQSMLRRRQIVAIHLVQSGSDEIMVRCNGPRVERRGEEWNGQFSRNGQQRGEEKRPHSSATWETGYLIKMRPWQSLSRLT